MSQALAQVLRTVSIQTLQQVEAAVRAELAAREALAAAVREPTGVWQRLGPRFKVETRATCVNATASLVADELELEPETESTFATLTPAEQGLDKILEDFFGTDDDEFLAKEGRHEPA